MSKQRVGKNFQPTAVKMRVVLWASNNKDKLQGKSLDEAIEIFKKELGVTLPETAVREMFKAVDLRWRDARVATDAKPRPADMRIRMLARIVRDLFAQLDTLVKKPANLDSLCDGTALTESQEP